MFAALKVRDAVGVGMPVLAAEASSPRLPLNPSHLGDCKFHPRSSSPRLSALQGGELPNVCCCVQS